MKKSLFVLLIPASLLLLSTNSYAAGNKASVSNIQLTCNGTALTLGQSQAEIAKSCGEPSYTRNYRKSNSTTLTYKQVDPKDSLIVSKTKFKFINDQLKEISYEFENEKFDD
ncbi:DUF2845 domain-containing protein [Cysteiniphilum halobium]|uniref:DUF2845 domain-containing protein n=1 Tax=Cysteiniphilum halobium TaxID=2219059 RepID=UPI0013C31385|nr:DUF2845 domain-containing protein [Cysteiniphilum halobium]